MAINTTIPAVSRSTSALGRGPQNAANSNNEKPLSVNQETPSPLWQMFRSRTQHVWWHRCSATKFCSSCGSRPVGNGWTCLATTELAPNCPFDKFIVILENIEPMTNCLEPRPGMPHDHAPLPLHKSLTGLHRVHSWIGTRQI